MFGEEGRHKSRCSMCQLLKGSPLPSTKEWRALRSVRGEVWRDTLMELTKDTGVVKIRLAIE